MVLNTSTVDTTNRSLPKMVDRSTCWAKAEAEAEATPRRRVPPTNPMAACAVAS